MPPLMVIQHVCVCVTLFSPHSIDLCLAAGHSRFFLAYQDQVTKGMITDLRTIRWHYITHMFVLDVIFMFPWASVVLSTTPSLYSFPVQQNSPSPALNYSSPSPPPSPLALAVALDVPNDALYVSLLGLLKLVGKIMIRFEPESAHEYHVPYTLMYCHIIGIHSLVLTIYYPMLTSS